MQALRSRPGVRRGGILYLRPDDIAPSPVQPRRYFDETALQELSESIRSYGVLNPLTVRLRAGRYELVAGEWRLRAARIAGLREVPCILVDVSMEDASLLALVENLQRKDLDCWEEAEGIARLMSLCGLTQEQAAARLGKSPSAVANKLRLLKHSPAVRAAIRETGLSERHARALLRLPEEAQRLEAVAVIAQRELSVARTEAYIDSLLSPAPKPGKPRKLLIKDLRLFLNSMDRHLETLRRAGIPAQLRREETEEEIILTVRLPRRETSNK